jgi:hypothetical protein
MKTYGFNAALYYSVPGLASDVMLNMAEVELGFLTDCNIVHKGQYIAMLRTTQYSQQVHGNLASNLHLGALSLCLPHDGFQWILDPAMDLTRIPDDCEIVYVLEDDFVYPKGLNRCDPPLTPVNTHPPDAKRLNCSPRDLSASVLESETVLEHGDKAEENS